MTDVTKKTKEGTNEETNEETNKEESSEELNNGGSNGDTGAGKDQSGVKAKEDAKAEPNLERGTLFDMRSKAEIAEEKRLANLSESQQKTERTRKEQEEKRDATAKKKKEEENRVYEAGTKLRYVGHLGRENIELAEPMNKKQVLAFLQDDYPEVTESRAKWRFDEDKKQIVITMGSFDKGSSGGLDLQYRRWV